VVELLPSKHTALGLILCTSQGSRGRKGGGKGRKEGGEGGREERRKKKEGRKERKKCFTDICHGYICKSALMHACISKGACSTALEIAANQATEIINKLAKDQSIQK
jgi:hypothetical protein